MNSLRVIRALILAAVILPGTLVATAAPSSAGIFISVNFGPPALPVYEQPIVPGPGYLWTPGYWSYNEGYYWVPGAWALPPSPGLLWTPPYWGYSGSSYGFHNGYWGRTVGFYGGINYGYGYGGNGFHGGYWQGNRFFYNRAVTRVNTTIIHNTYINKTVVVNNYNHTSYNGGPGGIAARPNAEQLRAAGQQHFAATTNQREHFAAARSDRAQYANNRSGFGHANEVNTRQGNQQSRISNGVRNGSLTPGEQRGLERRDNSIHSQARTERAANGGYLTPGERTQINARQNRVSRSIYNDRHNANNDAAAAARSGRTFRQIQRQAGQQHQAERPRGPEGNPRR